MKQYYWTHKVHFEDVAHVCLCFFACCWLFCCTLWAIVHSEQCCHSTRFTCVMSMRAAANSWCMNRRLLKMQGTEGTHMGIGMGKGLLFPWEPLLYHLSQRIQWRAWESYSTARWKTLNLLNTWQIENWVVTLGRASWSSSPAVHPDLCSSRRRTGCRLVQQEVRAGMELGPATCPEDILVRPMASQTIAHSISRPVSFWWVPTSSKLLAPYAQERALLSTSSAAARNLWDSAIITSYHWHHDQLLKTTAESICPATFCTKH